MPKYKLAQRPGFPNWYIVWSEGGRSRRASTGETDYKQAQRVLAAFILEVERPKQARRDEVGLASVLADYYDNHASNLPSAEQARIAVKLLNGHYKDAAISAVTLGSQDRYIAKRRKAVSDETISRELSVLRAALNRAVKYGVLESAPFVKSLPKAPPRERFLTRSEAARLLRACGSLHVRNFIRLALYTGARRGAILDLTWDRVDFENGLIYYPLPARTQTNKRRAVVPFEGTLARALRHAKKLTRSKYVINYHSGRVHSIKTGFNAACAAAGLEDVSPHTLRHTAATWAAQHGEDLYKVSGMLGQRHSRTTELYAKHQPDYLRSTARAIMRGVRQKRAKQELR